MIASEIASELHAAFLRALGGSVVGHGQVDRKPLSLDLSFPCPPKLRLYIYSLVAGLVGTTRPPEYKASLRLRGQGVGEYESFDFSEGRLALLVGYARDLDVFVLWDASLHPRFKNGGNIQVKANTVLGAAARGRAEQRRRLYSGVDELVIACQTPTLAQALEDRVATTGGLPRRIRG
jgi:hypothetical protein